MRYNHCYISLAVNEKLSNIDASKWLKTIEILCPSGIHASAEVTVNGCRKYSSIYVVKAGKRLVYVVPLSRDLTDNEASRIAIAWDKCWTAGDFEISYSQLESGLSRKQDLVDSVLDQISEDIAKKLHTDWVTAKVDRRWSYGPKYKPSHKRHPMLLPWEQLPTKQKLAEIERARKSLDILDSIDLKITRK